MERVSTSGNQTDFWQGEHDQIRTTLTRSGDCANCAMRTAARREFNSREARALLLEHSDEGHFTDARLKAFLVSYPVRKAHKECLKVTAVLKATARQLQATHQLSVETPTRFAPGPQNAQEVELLLHVWLCGRAARSRQAGHCQEAEEQVPDPPLERWRLASRSNQRDQQLPAGIRNER